MIIKITTKQVQFEFEDPSIVYSTSFGGESKGLLDFLKQLIDKVTEQSKEANK